MQASTQKKQQPPPQNQTLNKDSYKDVSKRLLTDSRYTSLPPEKKALVRGRLYDKYVAPFYKGLSPNARETFSKSGTGIQQQPPKVETNEFDLFKHVASLQGVKVARSFTTGAMKIDNVLQRAITYDAKNTNPEYEAAMKGLGEKFHNWIGRQVNESEAVADKIEAGEFKYLGDDYNKNLSIMHPVEMTEEAIKHPATTALRGASSFVGFFAENPEYAAASRAVGLGVSGLLGGTALSETLATGSVAQKMIYKGVKGAAEGYLISKAEDEHGQDTASSVAMFGLLEASGPLAGELGKRGKEAVKGNADNVIKFLSKLNVYAGPKRTFSVFEQLDKMSPEQLVKVEASASKEMGPALFKAGMKARDEVARNLGYENYAEAKKAGDQARIYTGLIRLTSQANKEAAVHNPELVALQAHKDVKQWATTPQGAEVAAIAKTAGIDPIKAALKTTTENVRKAAGDIRPEKVKAAKAAEAAIDKRIDDMFGGLGPGAASSKERDAYKNLLIQMKEVIPFERKIQKLTYMWGHREELPTGLLKPLMHFMQEAYGSKTKVWDTNAKRLETHLEKLIATGHVDPHDMRGVFASTKLSGRKTGWQKQLDDEFKTVSVAKKKEN